MHTATLRLRRGIAWPLSSRPQAQLLQILALFLAIYWASGSLSAWMQTVAAEHVLPPISIEREITRLWALPTDLARDFDFTLIHNELLGGERAVTFDPPQRRTLPPENFWSRAKGNSLHSVYIDNVSALNGTLSFRISYLTENPGDKLQYLLRQPVIIEPIAVEGLGRYIPTGVLTDPASADQARYDHALKITYRLEKSREVLQAEADADLAKSVGGNAWCAWPISVFFLGLIYFWQVRPRLLRLSRWLYPSSVAASPSAK